ncbi:MAG: flagellar filament capping protein FliD [Neptuniibacter sp.]
MSDSIIRSLGAGSGIDTTSLVSQLVEIERAPQEARLDTKQETLEAQISAYGVLKSSLSELQSFLEPLSDNDTFNSRSVSFSDSDAITPNFVEPGAQTGTYQIDVQEVAQAQSLASAAVADPDEDLGLAATGTLTISFGTWDYGTPQHTVNADRAALNIDIEPGESLNDLADKINAEDADLQATVLEVDGQFQLLLTAPSGESNALKITVSDAALSDFEFNESAMTMQETQQGQDAWLKVNGLDIYRETNEIDDVITGLDFSLNKADPGNAITFTVEEDTSIAEQSIRDFVDAYNLFFEAAQNLIGYSEDEETNQTVRGDLATDGTAKTLINRLRSSIGSVVPGVESGFTALTNVGIRTELDGTLSIDEDDFSSAMEDDFGLVETLFATKTSSTSNQVDVSVGSYASGTVAGSYDVVIATNPEKASTPAGTVGLDFSSPPLVIAEGDTSYSFKITVDGVESEDIYLTGSFGSEDEVASALQALINGDNNIDGANVAVDVSYDGVNDEFVFASRSYGSASSVSFSSSTTYGANAGLLGFGADYSDTGVDVVGTIAGETGFGSGNVLLPPIDTDTYGLNFTIGEAAAEAGTVTASFSRGFAGELNNLIDNFLSNSGGIQLREENINNSLDDITEDREELDRKMEAFELRLTAQYIAMEAIINSFQSVGNQLDGILERLPFTATNN